MRSSGNSKVSKTRVARTVRQPSRPTVTAQAVHHAPSVRTAELRLAPVAAVSPSSGHWSTTRDVMLALFLALGLTSAFFAPLRSSRTTQPVSTVASGRILGASTTVPLTITAAVTLNQSEWRQSMSPAPSSLVEVMSRMATVAGSTMEYRSLGQSMYLTKFLGLGDDATGSWRVSINGVTVTDLSLPVLEQGDDIRIERLPS